MLICVLLCLLLVVVLAVVFGEYICNKLGIEYGPIVIYDDDGYEYFVDATGHRQYLD